VDTCVYHLADALGVPGVVLFAGVRPEHRIAYHPYAEGVALEPPLSRLRGVRPARGASPEAGPASGADPAAGLLDLDPVLAALRRAVRRRRAARRAPAAAGAGGRRTAADHHVPAGTHPGEQG
jgi:hypothetical protein